MVIGILVFQFLMIGVFALKQNVLVTLFCLPLPMLTLIYYKTIRNRFDCLTHYFNLSLAKEIRTPEKEFLQVRWQRRSLTTYNSTVIQMGVFPRGISFSVFVFVLYIYYRLYIGRVHPTKWRIMSGTYVHQVAFGVERKYNTKVKLNSSGNRKVVL